MDPLEDVRRMASRGLGAWDQAAPLPSWLTPPVNTSSGAFGGMMGAMQRPSALLARPLMGQQGLQEMPMNGGTNPWAQALGGR